MIGKMRSWYRACESTHRNIKNLGIIRLKGKVVIVGIPTYRIRVKAGVQGPSCLGTNDQVS